MRKMIDGVVTKRKRPVDYSYIKYMIARERDRRSLKREGFVELDVRLIYSLQSRSSRVIDIKIAVHGFDIFVKLDENYNKYDSRV